MQKYSTCYVVISKSMLFVVGLLLLCFCSDSEALRQLPKLTRIARTSATFTAGTMLSFLSFGSPSFAGDGSGFVGTYSDPINHPGGTRTIRLLEAKVGDYQLAEVAGGGGRGEPKQYVLPAVVVGDRAIIIDFSPKGGPKDFTGTLDGSTGIKFPRDGNLWPRLQ